MGFPSERNKVCAATVVALLLSGREIEVSASLWGCISDCLFGQMKQRQREGEVVV